MAQQQDIRASPDKGPSIAYRVMEDAAAFYLARGDYQAAREHVDRLAGDMIFYDDVHEAYKAALAHIYEAEHAGRHRRARSEGGKVPAELTTPKAKELLERARQAGYLDDEYMTLLSRTESAILANALAACLGIRPKWKTFGEYWDLDNMRSDYNKGLDMVKAGAFISELKKMLPEWKVKTDQP